MKLSFAQLFVISALILCSGQRIWSQEKTFYDTDTIVPYNDGCLRIERGERNRRGKRNGVWQTFQVCDSLQSDSLIGESYWEAGRLRYYLVHYSKTDFKKVSYDSRGKVLSIVIQINGVEVYKQENNWVKKLAYRVERHENGTLKCEGGLKLYKLTNGELPGKYFLEEGLWKYYSKDGTLEQMVMYKKGEQVPLKL